MKKIISENLNALYSNRYDFLNLEKLYKKYLPIIHMKQKSDNSTMEEND